MQRRSFLAASIATAIPARSQPRYRVGVIGHTGRGNFGHGIGDVWSAFPQTEVVAVADPVERGRVEAQERTGAPRAYAEYRELLEKRAARHRERLPAARRPASVHGHGSR